MSISLLKPPVCLNLRMRVSGASLPACDFPFIFLMTNSTVFLIAILYDFLTSTSTPSISKSAHSTLFSSFIFERLIMVIVSLILVRSLIVLLLGEIDCSFLLYPPLLLDILYGHQYYLAV